ncbi:MAG: hypothetical protein AAGC78_13270 [Cellvibrio sp.]|uniref:hypothetical protein n=1 Tax=Cellvibrio sp. TaxID=1965322 RepID=UPI0031B486E9
MELVISQEQEAGVFASAGIDVNAMKLTVMAEIILNNFMKISLITIVKIISIE